MLHCFVHHFQLKPWVDLKEELMTAGRDCELVVEERTTVAAEVVVGCLAGNVGKGEEVVEQGKGLAVEEKENEMRVVEGQVPEKKTRGHMKILILSYPCTEHAGAYLQYTPTALDAVAFQCK